MGHDDALWALAGLVVVGWLMFGCVALIIDNIKEDRKNGKQEETPS